MNNASEVKQKRVVLYCRTAVRDNNKKESRAISHQVMALKKYAARRSMQVIRVYIDDGVSGNAINRPALTRLRADIKKGGTDALLIMNPDRLSRNLLLTTQLMQELQHQGVEVIFHKYGPEYQLLVGMALGFREFERRLSSDQSY